MTFPILGGNSAVGGYLIDNSLRFNDGDSAYLSRDFSGASRQTFTFSTWFKRSQLSTTMTLFSSGTSNTERTSLFINSDDTIRFFSSESASVAKLLVSSAVLRDSSAFYHFLLRYDSTDATASNRIRFYLNGNEMSYQGGAVYPAQNNATGYIGSNDTHGLGCLYYGATQTEFFDGYLSETHFIDGQALTPTDFGEFDEDSGIWKPKAYEGTYTGNSFYLDFENSGSLGADVSGLGNNFTPTNLASTDQTTDTPTNNFATFNAVDTPFTNPTFSEGNTKLVTEYSTYTYDVANFGLTTGKWYWEIKCTSSPDDDYFLVGISSTQPTAINQELGYFAHDWGLYGAGGVNSLRNNNAFSSYGGAITNGDIIGVALDLDNNRLYFSINGTFQNSSVPATGTNPISITAPSSTPRGAYFPAVCYLWGANSATFEANFGNPAFSISSGNSDDNGYGNFEYAPPSGYLALCTQNLATELSPTIDDGSLYQNQVLYTGTGSARDVTGYGFQPDWVWIKQRSGATYHRLYDSSRGAGQEVYSNATDAESDGSASQMSAFISDGFSIPTSGGNYTNTNTATYVAWGWKANGGTTSSNTDGDVTSTVQANTTAGFSIVTWTSTGGNESIGHGLGVVPAMFITKNRTAGANWKVYHHKNTSAPETDNVSLNKTDATQDDINAWNDTAPTSTTFTVGIDAGSGGSSGNNMVAYCFAEIEGYSKFGSYTGNGSSTDGTFVYTGFRPAWIMIKRTDSADNWIIFDNKRDSFNGVGKMVSANLSNGEYDDPTDNLDFVSNGFKLTTSNARDNASGGTYIYACFSANPFVSSTGIPVTAR